MLLVKSMQNFSPYQRPLRSQAFREREFHCEHYTRRKCSGSVLLFIIQIELGTRSKFAPAIPTLSVH